MSKMKDEWVKQQEAEMADGSNDEAHDLLVGFRNGWEALVEKEASNDEIVLKLIEFYKKVFEHLAADDPCAVCQTFRCVHDQSEVYAGKIHGFTEEDSD